MAWTSFSYIVTQIIAFDFMYVAARILTQRFPKVYGLLCGNRFICCNVCGSGFGLRNLCDWVVLWENCEDAKERKASWNMVCESGTAEFTKAVIAICVSYLGPSQEKSLVPAENPMEQEVMDALLRDILDAGEFGYSEAERMVGMDGDSWKAYVREFYHQMHINFPKAGKIIFLWPFLWIVTLVRFLGNNKRLNRVPVSAIMKKAGKRGQLVRRFTSQER